MKVVHLVQFYQPGYTGGIQRYVAELALAQQRIGLDVSVLTVALRQPWTQVDGAHPDAGQCWDGTVPVHSHQAWATFMRTPVYPLLFTELGKVDADVVHIHGPSPWFEAALRLRRPPRGKLVLTLHNTFPRSTVLQRRLAAVAELLLRRTIANASAVIAPHADYVRAMLPQADISRWEEKLRFVPPGVDHERFRPLGLEREPNRVLFVAHLRPEKGLHVLVDAMARLPDLELEVLATVSYEQSYYQQVRREAEARLGTRVRFVLDPEADTLVEAYNRAACLVVPSLGLESWNLVMLEAAACGSACVRTDIPGLTWADFAIAAPHGDPAGLALAIREAVEHRAELGTRARSAALGYSWQRTCDETLAVYRLACAVR